MVPRSFRLKELKGCEGGLSGLVGLTPFIEISAEAPYVSTSACLAMYGLATLSQAGVSRTLG